MNCQDISRALDSRDVNALSAAERRACEAHAASCPRCGPEWVVYTRLAALPAPTMPRELAARCEALAPAQRRVTDIRRPAGRTVLLGAILVATAAAAAAVKLGVPQLIAAAVAPRPATSDEVVAAPAARSKRTAPQPSAAPASGFTVHLRSLDYESSDPATMRMVEEYYSRFADHLRAVPGLQLIDDQAAATATTPAGFRVTIEAPDADIARQALGREQWAATLRVEVLKKPGADAAAVYLPAAGTTRGGVYGPDSIAAKLVVAPLSGKCAALILCTPAGIAAWQTKDLRMQVFPVDAALQGELEARFLDPAQPLHEHVNALNDLQALTAKTGGSMSEAVVREALQRIAHAPSEDERNTLWIFLRGQRRAELIPALVSRAQQDADQGARLEAINQLAADFPENPQARVALQWAMRNDPALLNRRMAERAVLGNGPWHDYVVATLKDSSQPLPRRLEPLRWMMIEGMPLAPLATALFGEDRQAFIDLFVQARGNATATQALGAIGAMKHPQAAGFVLAVFDGMPDRGYLQLLREHLDEARVYSRVEEIAADQSNPLQAVAAAMLRDMPGN